MNLSANDIEAIFNRCFQNSEGVILRGGAAEPYYQPGDGSAPAVLSYREDFRRSALHEISHWCVAGKERRKLPDFGYWYEPDGRNEAQQALFYKVEVKPQALEWIFSDACGINFMVSADNLDGDFSEKKESQLALAQFEEHVKSQKEIYLKSGLPPRAAVFADALKSTVSAFCSNK